MAFARMTCKNENDHEQGRDQKPTNYKISSRAHT